MSRMREITTIISNSNSDASDKLTNGFVPPATKQYSPLTSTTKSDRNNNNVMKKAMPPPIPPKKYHQNNGKTNTDPLDDNKVSAPRTNGSNTSQNAAINHGHGPNTLTSGNVRNELHTLSNPSRIDDKSDGKGHVASNGLDCAAVSATDCQASGFAGIASSDNHKKLNDDIVVSATESKSGLNSGTPHHCDNGMIISC